MPGVFACLMRTEAHRIRGNAVDAMVNVVNGLFSVPLNFQLVSPYTWDTINPYIQVSVEGQVLSPNEPVTTTAYAIVANSVINGAIGTPQLAAMAVTSTTIANGAIGAPQLAAMAVTPTAIANGAVGTPQLASMAVTSTTIADSAVTWQKIDATTIPSSGVGLVPPGAIMMFDSNCPSGSGLATRLLTHVFQWVQAVTEHQEALATHSASISEPVQR